MGSMRRVFVLQPSKPCYTLTWNVDNVLNYVRKLSPIKLISLKDLKLKLTMLMALVQTARVQKLHLLTVKNYMKLKSEFVFELSGCVKQSRPGFHSSFVSFKAYPPDRRLCIYSVERILE